MNIPYFLLLIFLFSCTTCLSNEEENKQKGLNGELIPGPPKQATPSTTPKTTTTTPEPELLEPGTLWNLGKYIKPEKGNSVNMITPSHRRSDIIKKNNLLIKGESSQPKSKGILRKFYPGSTLESTIHTPEDQQDPEEGEYTTETLSTSTNFPYGPLYVCNEDRSQATLINDVWRECQQTCLLNKEVSTTTVKMYHFKAVVKNIVVYTVTVLEMRDQCHEDVFGNEYHRKTSATVVLSKEEAKKYVNSDGKSLELNQDKLLGRHPLANCYYLYDNSETTHIVHVRKTEEVVKYDGGNNMWYIHLSVDNINVPVEDEFFAGMSAAYVWEQNKDTSSPPCQYEDDEQEHICIGETLNNDELQCPTLGITLTPPYYQRNAPNCYNANHIIDKDKRMVSLIRHGKSTLYDVIAPKGSDNPAMAATVTAITNIEKHLCDLSCNSMVEGRINPPAEGIVVDNPLGIWRIRNDALLCDHCDAISDYKFTTLSFKCTLEGWFGIRTKARHDKTYYWNLNNTVVTNNEPKCQEPQESAISETEFNQLLQDGKTLVTPMGSIHIDFKTMTISRTPIVHTYLPITRWFPIIKKDNDDRASAQSELEVAIIRQIGNISSSTPTNKDNQASEITYPSFRTISIAVENKVESWVNTTRKIMTYITWGFYLIIAIILIKVIYLIFKMLGTIGGAVNLTSHLSHEVLIRVSYGLLVSVILVYHILLLLLLVYIIIYTITRLYVYVKSRYRRPASGETSMGTTDEALHSNNKRRGHRSRRSRSRVTITKHGNEVTLL